MASLALAYVKGHNNEKSKKDNEKELTTFKLVMVLSFVQVSNLGEGNFSPQGNRSSGFPTRSDQPVESQNARGLKFWI